jgi:hypothetical protein
VDGDEGTLIHRLFLSMNHSDELPKLGDSNLATPESLLQNQDQTNMMMKMNAMRAPMWPP